MPLKLGNNNIDKIYLGGKEVIYIYKGNEKIYENKETSNLVLEYVPKFNVLYGYDFTIEITSLYTNPKTNETETLTHFIRTEDFTGEVPFSYTFKIYKDCPYSIKINYFDDDCTWTDTAPSWFDEGVRLYFDFSTDKNTLLDSVFAQNFNLNFESLPAYNTPKVYISNEKIDQKSETLYFSAIQFVKVDVPAEIEPNETFSSLYILNNNENVIIKGPSDYGFTNNLAVLGYKNSINYYDYDVNMDARFTRKFIYYWSDPYDSTHVGPSISYSTRELCHEDLENYYDITGNNASFILRHSAEISFNLEESAVNNMYNEYYDNTGLYLGYPMGDSNHNSPAFIHSFDTIDDKDDFKVYSKIPESYSSSDGKYLIDSYKDYAIPRTDYYLSSGNNKKYIDGILNGNISLPITSLTIPSVNLTTTQGTNDSISDDIVSSVYRDIVLSINNNYLEFKSVDVENNTIIESASVKIEKPDFFSDSSDKYFYYIPIEFRQYNAATDSDITFYFSKTDKDYTYHSLITETGHPSTNYWYVPTTFVRLDEYDIIMKGYNIVNYNHNSSNITSVFFYKDITRLL